MLLLLSLIACAGQPVGSTDPSGLPVARIEIDSRVDVAVAASQTLTAHVYDESGAEVRDRRVDWISANPDVASVSASGQVTGRASGQALVIASSEGRADTADVEVSTSATTPTPPAGGSSDAIALRVMRFAPGTGTVLVGNGIPLPPGRLREADLGKVRVWVGTTEKPLYVEALRGRHPDGSLRSVYVEFEQSLAGPVDGTLTTTTQRTLADRPRSQSARGTPAAVALPSSPAYLVSTGMVGPTLTSDQSRALGADFVRYENNFIQYADQHWTAAGAAWTENYYDRVLIYYAFWMRTGNPEYFNRANQLAVNYRRDYLEANNYGPSAHWSQMEGIEKHYLLTGDTLSRLAVGRVGDMFRTYMQYMNDTVQADTRILSRTLLAYLVANRIEAPTLQPSAPTWAALLDDALTRVLSVQRADGSYRFKVVCYQSLNYQTGLLNTVLVKYHDLYRADPRIQPAVQRALDYLWTQYVPDPTPTLNYISAACPDVGDVYGAPDLNGLFVDGFAWNYRKTGNATYRERADLLFAGMRDAWLAGSKQFNESYTSSFLYLGYR